MSYLVLARKYRPQTFASILGQEHISKALANSIIRGRVPHAFLFTGPRGVGKTTSARIIAKALNCTGREIPTNLNELDEVDGRKLVEPCGTCPNCVEIARSSSMAVWEIDGASNNSVENIRELIDSLRSLPPHGSKYKIYIIDEVHMLSTAAFNALLKSLEEPPPNTIFIFATTELHKIPETVISRCQIFDFRKLPVRTISEQLKQIAGEEKISVEDEVFELIARRARGGMRDAQSMFDRLLAFSHQEITLTLAHQVFSVVDRSILFDLSNAVASGDGKRCIELLDGIFSQSIDLKTFVGDLVEHWRNLLLVSAIGNSITGEPNAQSFEILDISQSELNEFKQSVKGFSSTFDLQRIFDVIIKISQEALHSNYPRYVLEAGFIKLSNLPSLRPLAEIISRIEGKTGTVMEKEIARSSSNEFTQSPVIEKKKSPAGAGFDPSWEDFITHIKSRSEFVLAAYLRRVSVRQFKQGILEVEANKFDVDALKDRETNETLKSCLHSYSSNSDWELKIEQHNSQDLEQYGSNDSNTSKVNGKNGSSTSSLGVPGSIAMQEYEADQQRTSRIREEATKDPVVVEALKTFVGSKIEKVSVLK
jgi:DNA polymerase-3 subunit gamma/tau